MTAFWLWATQAVRARQAEDDYAALLLEEVAALHQCVASSSQLNRQLFAQNQWLVQELKNRNETIAGMLDAVDRQVFGYEPAKSDKRWLH